MDWKIGSVAEARAAVDAGADMITAQGAEAGCHCRGESTLLPLLCGVLDPVDVPVLAAAGIADARGVAPPSSEVNGIAHRAQDCLRYVRLGLHRHHACP